MPSIFDRVAQFKKLPPYKPSRDELEAALSAITPSFNPDAGGPGLPSLPPTPAMPMPTRGNPGAISGPPNIPEEGAPTRYQRYQSEKEGYMRGTPGRGKSALIGALQGFARGGGLAGAATGAVYGAVDPRGLREQQFNQKVRPSILERFGFEDAERQAARQGQTDEQNRMVNEAKLDDLRADIEVKKSQAEKNRLPPPTRKPPLLNTGRGVYDPTLNNGQGGIIPDTAPPEKRQAPHWARDASGNYIDLNDPANAGKPVKGYDRPRAPKAAKEKAEKKYASITDVREAAEKAGMTESQMAAKFKEKGYQIVR